MKLVINKVINKMVLIKAFRDPTTRWYLTKSNDEVPLKDAIKYITNLPYKISDLTEDDANFLAENLKDAVELSFEKDLSDQPENCNLNINPSPETNAALIWYDTLSLQEQEHIKNLLIWWNRPVVC
jgi:hypothetical protein